MLRQTISDRIDSCEHVLLAGCGGGYDVMGAIPLLVELIKAGKRVSTFSFSFSALHKLDGVERMQNCEDLFRVTSEAATESKYCPEAWLAKFLDQEFDGDWAVWAVEITGVRPLKKAYEYLVDQEGIDCVVLVDGGIDAVLCGNEFSIGTPSEDLTSVAAVSALSVPNKFMTCVGFGAEMRDGICHEQAFSRISQLLRDGAYLGATALLPQTDAGRLYREAIQYIFKNQVAVKRSHIHKVVCQALEGQYGRHDEYIWLSPLMNMYWYFDLDIVAKTHKFLSELKDCETAFDVVQWVRSLRINTEKQKRSVIPI